MRHSLLIAVIAVLISACAQPARVDKMVVAGTDVRQLQDPSLRKAIVIGDVSGGEETNPMWTSEVGTTEFRGALELSLSQFGLLAESEDAAAYRLRANLLGLAQPVAGFDMTVTSHVNYELERREDGTPYFLDTVTADYTATIGDKFYAVERLRLANEGSIRENIRTFLDHLYAHDPATDPADLARGALPPEPMPDDSPDPENAVAQ